MSRERVPRRWKSAEIRGNESTDSEDSDTDSIEKSPYIKNTSTPLRRWSGPGEINRSPLKVPSNHQPSESSESSEDRKRERSRVKHSRGKSREENVVGKKKEIHGKRVRKKRGMRSQDVEIKKHRKDSSDSRSFDEPAVGEMEESNRKTHAYGGEHELPITEILKRSQEYARTKYEKPTPLPELTADKIYIQRRNGFSAMKIDRANDGKMQNGTLSIVDNETYPPIRVAIMAQKFWKNSGIVYQGILGGMALMHFLMLHVFFKASMEFVVDYSVISEIYTNTFSFLIALCIVSTFDKFDLARFDMEHLREVYTDYSKTIIAIPLYLVIFCLHQICLKTDDQLSLVHYYPSNESLWDNISSTNFEDFLIELNSWQKISISKDLLAVFAWFFVSLDTRDDAFLIHLESMEKYANDVESSGQ